LLNFGTTPKFTLDLKALGLPSTKQIYIKQKEEKA
jgi:hypothetical protein